MENQEIKNMVRGAIFQIIFLTFALPVCFVIGLVLNVLAGMKRFCEETQYMVRRTFETYAEAWRDLFASFRC